MLSSGMLVLLLLGGGVLEQQAFEDATEVPSMQEIGRHVPIASQDVSSGGSRTFADSTNIRKWSRVGHDCKVMQLPGRYGQVGTCCSSYYFGYSRE